VVGLLRWQGTQLKLSDKSSSIPKTQVGQRQITEYQDGGMPFGLSVI
jgi:hypothetical protein